MDIGFKIKKLRESRNLTQEQLAMQLDISQSELSKIENGKAKKIDFHLMGKVCAFFNKDFAFFQKTEDAAKILDNFNINNSAEIILLELTKITNEYKKKLNEDIGNEI